MKAKTRELKLPRARKSSRSRERADDDYMNHENDEMANEHAARRARNSLRISSAGFLFTRREAGGRAASRADPA